MPQSADQAAMRRNGETGTRIGLAAAVAFFVLAAVVSYANTQNMRKNAADVAGTHDIILILHRTLSSLKDAETGQRGYIITGRPEYLGPYELATKETVELLTTLDGLLKEAELSDEPMQSLRAQVQLKFKELQASIALRNRDGFEAAQDYVNADRGRLTMDAIRGIIGEMQQDARELRQLRLIQLEDAYRLALLGGVGTALLGLAISVMIALMLRRAARERQRQVWLQTGQAQLGEALLGDQRSEQLGQHILAHLASYLDAQAGAFYVKENGHFRRVATIGVASAADTPERFTTEDGVLGRAARERKAILLHDVPAGYLRIGSALGSSDPRHLVVAPALADEEVNAVLELGFLQPLTPNMLDLLQQLASVIGVAVRSAAYRSHLQSLLEETQRQSEELQTQSEELRVSNEELEEQSRALKASQHNLEQQQIELEQSNAQLEEQTQLLEAQRDDLSRSKADVQLKAQELERASQYKSDFLANMSHELRTPLNSSLILAKLLADNSKGNLNDEQVKYAQTIQSSGNDLLNLINDILDLSKIEAGHMEVRAETITLSRLLENISASFAPMAEHKGLRFAVAADAALPKHMVSDRQRLEQVLRNLLSNAIKFTEKGSVTLRVEPQGEKQLRFTVADTGIGISPEQQDSVFDAFRQADGTISRKYGGTGLGLSISRELARLLGGHIELTSEAGTGSCFTLVLPTQYDASLVPAEAPKPVTVAPMPEIAPRSAPLTAATEDDRSTLDGQKRTILVVEDDVSFARILYDLVHELEFQCLIAHTAEDAVAMARQYVPSAVVLDVGLPDHSGLSVLDRLKRDTRTRHIPVHVVSANDYAQTALALGAVGYMIKPVKRVELADALKKLETRLEQRLRRVLIVEDDPVQRDSVSALLGTQEVQTQCVGSAAQCLEQLKSQTFDCMVLDLNLPDATGYSLLETLSNEESYSFPPVIVYTGRDLTAEEEQKLRRYSKSIIIKGAKSPERLLDEVTLFLHQVVSELPMEQRRMLEKSMNRDAALEGKRILVVEDDIRNIYALTSIFEQHEVAIAVARNGREALEILERDMDDPASRIDLVLMDVMMPEMDGITATREIRKRKAWAKLPVIMLTAKAMKDDQERCLDAGANDYMAKPLDVEKLLSLVRVWMPR